MKNTIKEIIYSAADLIKGSFPYEVYSDICIYLIFLKYILDNEKMPYDKTSFELQRMFDRAELNEEALINASISLEKQYEFPQNSLVDLAQMYIRFNKTKVLNNLSEINFKKQGKEIVKALKEMLYLSAKHFGRIMSDKMTSKPLSNLIKELIDIGYKDHYADFMYGMGISTLEIVGDEKCCITGYERERSSIAAAKMLLIISERRDVELILGDVLDIKIPENSFDKIVTMPPLGVRVKEFSPASIKLLDKFCLPKKPLKMDSLILLKAITALKERGTAIISVTPNFLSSIAVMDKAVRKLIVEKYLKAVIQLPNLYYGTGVLPILLVIEKSRQTNDVLFINAETNEFFDFFGKSYGPVANLTREGIVKIKELYQTKKSEEGISYVATTETIKENNFLLTLAKYVKVKRKREVISNQEIDIRLRELYSELKEILGREDF